MGKYSDAGIVIFLIVWSELCTRLVFKRENTPFSLFPLNNVPKFSTASLFSLGNHFFFPVWANRLATDSLGGQRVDVSSRALSDRGAWQELSHITKTTWLLLNHLSRRLLIVLFMKEEALLADFIVRWTCISEVAGKLRKDELNPEEFKLFLFLPTMKLVQLVPCCTIKPCSLSSHRYFEWVNRSFFGFFSSFARGRVRGHFFKALSEPQHKLHLCFADCFVELECHHTSFASERERRQGGRLLGASPTPCLQEGG